MKSDLNFTFYKRIYKFKLTNRNMMDWVLLSLLNATPSNDNVEELSTDYKFATAFIFLHLCYPNATNSDMNANVYYF